MPVIHRRTFLERLGLGAGAALLGPSLQAFVRDAHAQTSPPKRLIMIVQGNGMNWVSFAPPGHKPKDLQARGIPETQLYTADNITLPDMFADLAPYKDCILQVDGLSNQQGQASGSHTFHYGATTCMKDTPAPGGDPGGISFDQLVANGIGQGSIFPSIVLGPSDSTDKVALKKSLWSAGAGRPVSVLVWAQAAYKQTFSNIAPGSATGTTSAGPQPAFVRRKKLLDYMRNDIKRAKAQLAAPEQPKMDQLLSSLEMLDARMAQLATSAGKVGKIDLQPVADEPALLEDRVDLHFQIFTTALTANLTRVIGYNAQSSGSPNDLYWRKHGFVLDAHSHGHGLTESATKQPLDVIHNFHAGLLARTIAALKAVPEGGKTMFDNTVIVWYADASEQHHGNGHRWPTLVMASPGGYLKTGGRFVRYPVATRVVGEAFHNPTPEQVAAGKVPGCRSMPDLFCTLGHALGVPTDTFGKGGNEPVQGVLNELVA